MQATLKLLTTAGQRGLTLVADCQLALNCLGAGVQRAALGVECAQALAQRAQLVAHRAQIEGGGGLSGAARLQLFD